MAAAVRNEDSDGLDENQIPSLEVITARLDGG